MAYYSEIAADAPVIYWRMSDSSSTFVGTDGTITNGLHNASLIGSPTRQVTGIPGAGADTATEFDGVNDSMSDDGDIALGTIRPWWNAANALTVEFWYKGTATGSTDDRESEEFLSVWSTEVGASGKYWRLTLDTTGKVRAWAAPDGFGDLAAVGVSTTSVNDGDWHHIVFNVWPDPYDTELWVDANLEATDNAGLVGATGSSLHGMRNADSVVYLAGTLDEVAIYFDVAGSTFDTPLSGTRIAAHYAAGLSALGTSSGTLTLTGSAEGSVPSQGLASGSLLLSGAASGVGEGMGSASGTLTLAGLASGYGPLYGAASGSLTLVGSGSGVAPVSGFASGTLILGGSATPPQAPPTYDFFGGGCSHTIEGNLILNEIPMKTDAWACTDLTPLWMPPTIRGADRVIPEGSGVIKNRRRRTATRYALDFRISGFVPGSNPSSNGPEEFEQLEYNLNFLRQNVLDPRVSPNPDGTVPGLLIMPSGDIRAASVHVLGFTINNRVSHVIQGTLELSIPSGGFS